MGRIGVYEGVGRGARLLGVAAAELRFGQTDGRTCAILIFGACGKKSPCGFGLVIASKTAEGKSAVVGDLLQSGQIFGRR